MDAAGARDRFAAERIARLATTRPRIVPIVYALLGDALYFVVDAKPKTTTRLARLADIEADPRVSVLVDHYDEDWDALWWARADGTATVLADPRPDAMAALAERYPAYRVPPPGPLVEIAVHRWSGWSAAPA